jgi:hypothetical protein
MVVKYCKEKRIINNLSKNEVKGHSFLHLLFQLLSAAVSFAQLMYLAICISCRGFMRIRMQLIFTVVTNKALHYYE